MTTVVEFVGALAGLVAAVVAAWALRIARQTFSRDHRPIVRVVAKMPASATTPAQMILGSVLLKNIGRGPGLSVIVYDHKAETLLGDLDAIEPLGSADDERNRPGRVDVPLRQAMVMNQTYELYYQDVLSKWHLTRFRPTPDGIQCAFAGEVSDRTLPGAVRVLGTVAKP